MPVIIPSSVIYLTKSSIFSLIAIKSTFARYVEQKFMALRYIKKEPIAMLAEAIILELNQNDN